jgi:hypothetical protein
MWAREYGVVFVAFGVAFACGGKSTTTRDGDDTNDAGEGSGGFTSTGGATNGGGPQGGSVGKGGRGGSAGKGGRGGTGGLPATGGSGGDAGESVAGEGAGGAGGTGSDVVCTGNVGIASDADLRTFAARGCEVLEGSLTIQSPTLTSMALLGEPSVLRVITGDLVVQQNPVLDNIEGFLGLERIGGSLIVTQSYLRNLGGLEMLTLLGSNAFGNALILMQNPRLANVAALGNLQRLLTNINVGANDSLTSLAGIDRLAITNSVTITNNPVLAEIGGLTDLRVSDGFTVAVNPALQTIILPSLTEVTALTITSNGSLASVSMPSLETAESLTIAENQMLTTVGRLDALTSVGMLIMTGNPMLPQCFVDQLDLRLRACNMTCGGNDRTATCE